MSAIYDKTVHIQSLQRMMERLSASDLTAAESLEIRPRLFQLLNEIEGNQVKTKVASGVLAGPHSRSDRDA